MLDQKEIQFGVRVPAHLKEAFVESCKSQDTTASREIRAFMTKYIKQHGQKSFI